MKHSKFLMTLCFCWLVNFSKSTAQIVNIEDRRSLYTDTIAWSGGADIGFNLVENGNAIYTFQVGVNAEHRRHRHLFLSFTRFNLVRVEQEDFVNDGFEHLRYNYRLRPWLTWEIFGQIQYNEKIRLRFRGLSGTGLRFSLLPERSKNRTFVGALYMYEYNEENLSRETGEKFIQYQRDHRLSTYLAFRFPLTGNVTLASTSYYQPAFNNFSDLRLSSQTSLQIGLSQKLQFTTNFSIIYDSRVPDEVPNTTYKWVNGIKWNW